MGGRIIILFLLAIVAVTLPAVFDELESINIVPCVVGAVVVYVLLNFVMSLFRSVSSRTQSSVQTPPTFAEQGGEVWTDNLGQHVKRGRLAVVIFPNKKGSLSMHYTDESGTHLVKHVADGTEHDMMEFMERMFK
jgi:hypothetical protein